MNNDFGVTRDAICQSVSLVTSSLVKIIGKSPHSWPKIVIHGNSCIIVYFCIHDTLIKYSDVMISTMAVNSLHKEPVTRKMFSFNDVILYGNFNWNVADTTFII